LLTSDHTLNKERKKVHNRPSTLIERSALFTATDGEIYNGKKVKVWILDTAMLA